MRPARLGLLWKCSDHSPTYTGVLLVLGVFVFKGTTKPPPPCISYANIGCRDPTRIVPIGYRDPTRTITIGC